MNLPIVGPVFVEFPIDTLYPYPLVKREIGMKDSGPQNLVQKIVNWYAILSLVYITCYHVVQQYVIVILKKSPVNICRLS